MINITLKGGTVKEFDSGVTPYEVAKSIGAGLAKAVCAATVNGKEVDLRTPLNQDCALELLTFVTEGIIYKKYHKEASFYDNGLDHRPGCGWRYHDRRLAGPDFQKA